MASIIRIKRSETSGNPAVLGAGELAYSGLTAAGEFTASGDRLYIGMGTETAGNAVNHVVIGGKFFTDMLDHSKGTLTANSAIITDADSKIDLLNVDNLTFDGNTVSSTNVNGNIILAPNGSGLISVSSTRIVNLANPVDAQDAVTKSFLETYVADNTANDEEMQDLVGAMVTDNTENGISVTYDDAAGKLNFDVNDPIITIDGDVDGSATMTDLGNTTITVTLDTVNSNVGTFGSATAIPILTVNAKGLVTAVSTADIATTLGIAGDTGTDSVSLLSDTLTFVGTDPVQTAVTANTVTISVDNATTATRGIASFNTAGFDVTSGAVSLKTNVVQGITTDTGALTVSGNAITIVGGEGINVTHAGTVITVDGELASDSNIGVAKFNTASFTVTNGDVTIKSGGVTNAQLVNSSVTFGTTTVALGAASTAITGVTQLDVDNITINDNTISATNVGGSITLTPNGVGTVDVTGARITSVGTPTQSTDAATKGYVDSVAEGLDVKLSVRVTTTGNITLSGEQTIDGVAVVSGDRVLVKDQTTGSENGIYIVSAGAWTRSTDFNTSADATSGAFTFSSEGTLYKDTGWVLTTDDPIVLGTTALVFTQFSGAGSYSAGDGLSLIGTEFDVLLSPTGGLGFTGSNSIELKSTVAGAGLTLTSGVLDVVGTANRITVNADSIDIASTYVGQDSITTVGTLTSGELGTGFTTVAVPQGGTGVTSLTSNGIVYGNGSNPVQVTPAGTYDATNSMGQLLSVNASGVPTWTNVIDGGTY